MNDQDEWLIDIQQDVEDSTLSPILPHWFLTDQETKAVSWQRKNHGRSMKETEPSNGPATAFDAVANTDLMLWPLLLKYN